MRSFFESTSRRVADRLRRTRRLRARRTVFESLEDRATPAVGFGYALALGGPASDVTTSVAADGAGDVYVAGAFSGTVDFDRGPGVFNLTAAGGTAPDAYLAKYGPTGSLLWAGSIVDAGPFNGFRLGLAQAPNGDVVLSGQFSAPTNFGLTASGTVLTPGPSASAFVARYTPGGSLAWAKAIGGGSAAMLGNTVAVDSLGQVYTAGVMSNGSADLDPGPGVFTVTNVTGNANTYIAKLDGAGGFISGGAFENQGPGAAGVWPSDIAVDANQNLYVTGIFVGTVDFNPGAGVSLKTTADDASLGGDGYVAKLTPAGALSYFVSVGSAKRDDGNGIAVDAAGNAYVTGDILADATIKSSAGGLQPTLATAGTFDGYVMKLDPLGAVSWASRFGSSSFDEGLEIAYDGASSLYITGLYTGAVNFGAIPLAGSANYDPFVARLGTDGSFTWAVGANGPQFDLGVDVAVNPAGDVFTVGRFQATVDFDPGPGTFNLTSIGSDADGFVWKLTQPQPNQPPTAANDSYTTAEDSPLSVAAPGVLLNDSDPNNDPLTAVLVSGPSHGSLTLRPNGSFLYTPDPNYNGPDSFVYKASDGQASSNTAVVSLDVLPVNDPPVAINDGYTADEDVTLAASTVLVNDYDVDHDAFTAILVTGPSHGSLTFNADGTFLYAPDANYNGTDLFTYKLTDGRAFSNVASVILTVRAANDAPRAVGDSFTTDEDAPLVIAAPGVLLNDTDVEGDPLSVIFATSPAHGSLNLFADGSFTYTPDPNYNGVDSFTYRAGDGQDASNLATVSLTIRAVDDPPVASNDAYSTDEDVSLSASSVIVNDFDVEGDSLSALLVTGPSHGTLTFNADGTFLYAPDPNYNGSDLFTYKVTDGQASSNVASVALTIRAVNDAPTAFRDSYTTDEDAPLVITAPGVIANDSDVEGDRLTASLSAGPLHGTLTFNADGSFRYAPDPNFNGTDYFLYQLTDGQAFSGTATVAIVVRPVNDAPTAANQSFSVPEQSLNGTLVGVFHASDVDGDLLSYSIVAGNVGGGFAIDAASGRITVADGSLVDYETRPQYVLTVKASDPSGSSTTATATINLIDVAENMAVRIDIRPEETPNTINLKSQGKIEVAILSSAGFNARDVDVESVRFGRTGSENSASRLPKGGVRFEYEDVDGDGRLDLVVEFQTSLTGFQVGDSVGVLTGRTRAGVRFEGRDGVRVINPGK